MTKIEKLESMGYKIVINPYNTKIQIVKFDEDFGMKPETGYFHRKELSKKINDIIKQ